MPQVASFVAAVPVRTGKALRLRSAYFLAERAHLGRIQFGAHIIEKYYGRMSRSFLSAEEGGFIVNGWTT